MDFRNSLFKKIYAEIYPEKEDRVIELLQIKDTANDGYVSA